MKTIKTSRIPREITLEDLNFIKKNQNNSLELIQFAVSLAKNALNTPNYKVKHILDGEYVCVLCALSLCVYASCMLYSAICNILKVRASNTLFVAVLLLYAVRHDYMSCRLCHV